MDKDTIIMTALGGGCCFLLLGGVLLLIVGTLMKTRFGVNIPGIFGGTRCSNCDAGMPPVRMPADGYETLWGGWTCPECGQKNDKWGNLRSGSSGSRKKTHRKKDRRADD